MTAAAAEEYRDEVEDLLARAYPSSRICGQDSGDSRQPWCGARMGDVIVVRRGLTSYVAVDLRVRITSRGPHRQLGVGRAGYTVCGDILGWTHVSRVV